MRVPGHEMTAYALSREICIRRDQEGGCRDVLKIVSVAHANFLLDLAQAWPVAENRCVQTGNQYVGARYHGYNVLGNAEATVPATLENTDTILDAA